MIIVCLLVTTPLVSAFFQFDNIKGDLTKDKDTSEYGKVEIRNSLFGIPWLQLDKIMSLELKDNTELCPAESCSANTEIIMYEDGKLIDGIKFIDLKTGEETNIKSYEIYVNGDLYNYEEVSGYSDGIKYNVELKGELYPFQQVDWQIKSANTDWIEDWAVWSDSLTNGTLAYWKFDESSGTDVEDLTGNYDLITNTTNWTTGKINNGLAFDNPDTNAYSSTLLDFNATDLSFSFWFKLVKTHDTTSPSTGLFSKVDYPDQNQVVIGLDAASGKMYMPIRGEAQSATFFGNSTNWTAGTWYHVALVWDGGSNISLYINGVHNSTKDFAYKLNTSSLLYDFSISRSHWGIGFNGTIDEFGVWNRTLLDSEITDLYNSESGISPPYTPSVTLGIPVDNYNTTNKSVTFNCTAIISGGLKIDNVSLYHNETGTWTLNQTNSTSRLSNSTLTLDIDFQNHESMKWNCYSCANNSRCVWGTNRTLNLKEVIVNNQTYNSTAWETDRETFIVNVTGSGSALTANLWYNGTSYAGTKTGNNYEALFSKTLDISTVLGNKSLYWEVSLGGTPYVNFTEVIQRVNQTLLGLCNITLTTAYINYSFSDEENGTLMNGSIDITTWDYYFGTGVYNKSATFSNTSGNEYYGFCLNPDAGDKTLHHRTVVQYYSSGYPQRRWTYSTDLTNSTLNQVLYLLGSADGIYSIYQAQTNTGGPIPGVTVQAERQFAGTWTLIEQGTTDGAGTVTFWLNPDYDHRLTFTKADYTSVQVTIRPSSSTYTVIMGTGVGDAEYTNQTLEGIRWTITPKSGGVTPNTNISVGFNVTASKSNLHSCKIEIVNLSTTLASTTGCSSVGGNISLPFNITNHRRVWGKFYVNTGGGYFIVEGDAYWFAIESNISDYTIKSFLEKLRDSDLGIFGEDCNKGEPCRAEYSRIVFFFFVLFLIFALVSHSTGYDFSSGGALIIILFPIILFVSVAGWLEISMIATPPWIDKYVVSIIAFFFTGGWILNHLSKT